MRRAGVRMTRQIGTIGSSSKWGVIENEWVPQMNEESSGYLCETLRAQGLVVHSTASP